MTPERTAVNSAELTFVRILFSFVSGILLTYHITNTVFLIYLPFLCLTFLLYFVTINPGYKSSKAHRYKGLNDLIFQVMLFFFGCSCCVLHKQHLHADYYAFKKHKTLKITVIDEPDTGHNMVRFKANVCSGYGPKRSAVSGKIMVSVKTDPQHTLSLQYGDELIVPTRILPIRPPLNPSEFDFKAWLASKNIYHQTFLKQAELIKLNTGKGNRLIAYALRLRKRQVDTYRRIIKDDEAFAVAATLILGYRSDLNDNTLNTYAKTGTIHALSVSGMHVGLIYLVISWLLSFLNTRQSLRIVKCILILSLIWLYSLFTGFSPAVMRSVIMLSAYILAKLFSKTINSYNVIAFAAFCLLVYDPFLVWDVGFQLSFTAVFGLIYLQPKIQSWLFIKYNWLNKIWSATALSAAAQLATYPLSIYYFHQFPVYFLVSNLFIMLPMALILYIGFIILLFDIPQLGHVFELIIRFTNTGLSKIADLPFSGITGIWISKVELVLLCVALALFIMALDRLKKQLLTAALVVFLSFQCFLTYDKLYAAQQKKVIRFRLKQHYAIAVISGNHATLFTDLDPGSKTYFYFIKPALDQHKITSIAFKETGNTSRKQGNLFKKIRQKQFKIE